MSKEQTLEASGIQVLEPVIGEYIFARPFKGDEARDVYKEVRRRVEKDFKDSPMFGAYFKFNEQTGEINGINAGYGILINDVLSQEGLWLPTIAQARKLDEAGKLSNGVWRRYGIAIYDKNNPNSDIAGRLTEEAEKRGWELPILASFKALKLIKTGARTGFGKDYDGVLTGEQARELLKKFNYVGISGAQGVDRYTDGYWGADWYDLDDSSENGRVDWICGKATQKNLEQSVLTSISDVAVQRFNEKLSLAQKAASDVLKQ
jgi:hypothetical protein